MSDEVCPDCKKPVSSHALYREGRCPVVRFSGLRRLSCAHANQTTEDGEGYAVCLDCGTTVVVRLTQAMLDKAIENGLKRGGF